MHTIKTNRIDIRSWCPEVEQSAIDQMIAIGNLPYVREACLMPDGHWGMNCCIGGVVATQGVIVPSFVGMDVGCGMCALKTNIKREQITEVIRHKLHAMISREIPVGFSHNTDKRRNELGNRYRHEYEKILKESEIASYEDRPVVGWNKAFFSQVGTLGGGNHFIEIQYDEDDNVWVMIHSGSRNIGKKVCDHFNAKAEELNDMWFSATQGVPFLPVDTEEGKAYLAWMEFALQFAFLNRQVMMEEVKGVFARVFDDVKFITDELVDDTVEGNIINIHHNYASLEHHHGKNVWVHRKGATKAGDGNTGIIPGSMETNSFIVKGLNNHLSLKSCSHGSGRKCGRKEFNVNNNDKVDEIKARLQEKGITYSKFTTSTRGRDKGMLDLSETGEAYKDVMSVMANQTDLVEILVKLAPLVSIKG
jgi:tRNA-splicing ligase RtcB